MTKREFLKTTGVISSVAAIPGLGSALGFAAMPGPSNTDTGGALYPFFWTEDVALLAQLDASLKAKFQASLHYNLQYLQFGRAWRATPQQARTLLRESRELLLNGKTEHDRAYTQATLVLGWALADQFPLRLDADGPTAEQELALDAYLLQTFQTMATGEFAVTAPAEDIAHLLGQIRQRNLLRLHTFRPEWDDIETWLDGFLDGFRALEARDLALAKAYLKTDSADSLPYDLYDPGNVLTDAALKLRYGRLTTNVGFPYDPVARYPSLYERSLRGALKLVRAVDGYLAGRTGKPGFF